MEKRLFPENLRKSRESSAETNNENRNRGRKLETSITILSNGKGKIKE